MILKRLIDRGYSVDARHHAEAILKHDMRAALGELESVLLEVSIPARELIEGGGGEGEMTQRLRRSFYDLEWLKHEFDIKKTIDGKESESISHEVDHVKTFNEYSFALEIEWNNKDPFFDRDLENFKRLHADGAISVGAIVTRGESLQNYLRDIVHRFALKHGVNTLEKVAEYYTPTSRQKRLILQQEQTRGSFEKGWAYAFVSDKFGEATTHWRKLQDRVSRGVGNPCPLLLIGIPKEVVKL